MRSAPTGPLRARATRKLEIYLPNGQAMRMIPMMAIDDDIRAALDACSRSRYSLAREMGVAESTLSRFLHGERGLKVAKLHHLADLLGLEIVVRPKEDGKEAN